RWTDGWARAFRGRVLASRGRAPASTGRAARRRRARPAPRRSTAPLFARVPRPAATSAPAIARRAAVLAFDASGRSASSIAPIESHGLGIFWANLPNAKIARRAGTQFRDWRDG